MSTENTIWEVAEILQELGYLAPYPGQRNKEAWILVAKALKHIQMRLEIADEKDAYGR
jgi:hypothetical protein